MAWTVWIDGGGREQRLRWRHASGHASETNIIIWTDLTMNIVIIIDLAPLGSNAYDIFMELVNRYSQQHIRLYTLDFINLISQGL
jgi:hypothetical protein